MVSFDICATSNYYSNLENNLISLPDVCWGFFQSKLNSLGDNIERPIMLWRIAYKEGGQLENNV